ncbi:hypothetical protein GCM10009865_07310 [Aeromicrobium ponti]
MSCGSADQRENRQAQVAEEHRTARGSLSAWSRNKQSSLQSQQDRESFSILFL